MFYINREVELTPMMLGKMIEAYNTNILPQLIKRKQYYDGNQKILSKRYKDESKPCNKTVINYCKNITDSYCGYIATPNTITYRSQNDIEEIMDILKYNDYQTEDADFLLDALIYGVAAELMFIDNDGKTRFRLIKPTQCFAIYDDSLTGDLLYFVRFYKENEWDDYSKYILDVYSDSTIKHYSMEEGGKSISLLGEDPHYFNQCPANIFSLADEKSIFDCVIGLQDAANELVSAEIDDYSAFCDAYLALVGVDADPEDIAAMKENRVLVLPEGANASWLTKSANDAQVENILKRIHDSIYRVAQCPDFSSESFVSGVSSGIAIKYKLTGMETRAGKIEASMKKALQRRIEIICGIASLKLGEEVFKDIEITFQRNIPEDITATIALVSNLKGVVSDATLLSQLPFVSDANAELDAIQKQKQENMKVYGFGANDTLIEDHADKEEDEE